jgi:hypothetical protein
LGNQSAAAASAADDDDKYGELSPQKYSLSDVYKTEVKENFTCWV